MYKLLSIDLDGTFLTTDKKISKENLDSLLYAREKGIFIVFNTGRLPKSVYRFVNQLPFPVPLICCNGSIIFDENKNLIKYFDINNKDVYEIFNKVKKVEGIHINFVDKLGQTLYSETYEYNCKVTYENNIKLPKNERTEIRIIPDAIEYIQNNNMNIVKMVIQGDNEIMKTAYEMIKEVKNIRIEHYENALEIISSETNKLNGLSYFCSLNNIKLSECISIGDTLIDLSMIKGSGLGVAVANAHNKLKKCAKYITQNTNNNNAVSEVIHKFI